MISEKTICRKSRSRSETLWFPIIMRHHGGDKHGIQLGGAAAIQGRHAAENSSGIDRGGCWARASATAPGVGARGGVTTRQPTVRPRRRP